MEEEVVKMHPEVAEVFICNEIENNFLKALKGYNSEIDPQPEIPTNEIASAVLHGGVLVGWEAFNVLYQLRWIGVKFEDEGSKLKMNKPSDMSEEEWREVKEECSPQIEGIKQAFAVAKIMLDGKETAVEDIVNIFS